MLDAVTSFIRQNKDESIKVESPIHFIETFHQDAMHGVVDRGAYEHHFLISRVDHTCVSKKKGGECHIYMYFYIYIQHYFSLSPDAIAYMVAISP